MGAIGILVLGSRTISTVGGKMAVFTPSRSYATQMGAAVALMAASVAGMPVSTSHCLVGSVVGIGLVQTCSGHKGVLELAVLRRIVAGWVATIPLAMVVTAILFLPTQGYYLSTPAPSEVIVTPGAAGNASTLP